MHTALHNCNVQMTLFLTLTSWWSPCLYFVYSAGVSELRIRSSTHINLVVLVITCRYFITGQTDCRFVVTAYPCCFFHPGNKHMCACDMFCSPTVWAEFGNSVVTVARQSLHRSALMPKAPWCIRSTRLVANWPCFGAFHLYTSCLTSRNLLLLRLTKNPSWVGVSVLLCDKFVVEVSDHLTIFGFIPAICDLAEPWTPTCIIMNILMVL